MNEGEPQEQPAQQPQAPEPEPTGPDPSLPFKRDGQGDGERIDKRDR